MATITAILEADADGTLHLPVPASMRQGKVRVEARLESIRPDDGVSPPLSSPSSVTPEMLEARRQALATLRQMDPFRDIDDPVSWQRDLRRDRTPPESE